MNKRLSMIAVLLLLAGCGNSNNEENMVKEGKEKTTEEVVTTEKTTTEKPTTETPSSEDKKVEDGDVTDVNGYAHIKLPRVDTYEYGQVILSNTFNIKGYHAGEEVGDLIEQLGKAKSEKSNEYGTTYEYDNFSVTVRDGRIYAFSLDISDQHITSNLQKEWGHESELTYSEFMRFDGNKTNGYYIEVYPDLSKGELSGISIIGENYKNAVPATHSGTYDLDTSSVATYDFGQQILSNSFNIEGIGVGDVVSHDEIIRKLGDAGPYSEESGYYDYGDFSLMLDADNRVSNIMINVSNDNISLQTLKDAWNKDSESDGDDSYMTTIYDGDKTNGYYIEVDSMDNSVQYITIYNGNRE